MGATTTTVLVTVLGCGVVALVVALLVLRGRAAAERSRRQRLEHELEQARTDVAALGRRLDHLGHEVHEARDTAERAAARSDRLAARTEREFVITSLGDAAPTLPHERAPRSPATVLEDKLVSVASRSGGSSAAAAATGLAVKAAGLAHGVRRALSPEVLDRAAAEATVARRRSRRDRKRELREVRRMVRAVPERPSGKHVA